MGSDIVSKGGAVRGRGADNVAGRATHGCPNSIVLQPVLLLVYHTCRITERIERSRVTVVGIVICKRNEMMRRRAYQPTPGPRPPFD